MFISEQEASDRLNSADNLINIKSKSLVDKMLREAFEVSSPILSDDPSTDDVDFSDEDDSSDEDKIEEESICEKQEQINVGTVYSASKSYKKKRPDSGCAKSPTLPPEVHVHTTKQVGDKRVPAFIREIAAVDAQFAPAREVAAQFNISPSTVAVAKHDPALKANVDAALEKVKGKAIEKLMLSLGLLSEQKIQVSSAKDISAIAVNMSKIAVDAQPAKDGGNAVQIMIYAPPMKNENDYDTITVVEKKR